MSKILTTNKYFVVTFILAIILGGMTYGNLPGVEPAAPVLVVDGETFNFADYGTVTHEQVAIFNYLTTLFDQPTDDWDGWYIEPQYYGLFHYVLAFMAYSLAMYYETTPGYRTDYYSDVSSGLIEKFNTSYADYGEDSIEYMEWMYASLYLNWTEYYYPDAVNPDADDIYTGGFRGPANIMWTAHYALMELLHERNFNLAIYDDEIDYYMEDWNMSMTTDGFGNPQEGGIWETGMIPCEPYEVWTQCTCVPIYMTELYDNMYGTDYMPIWDFGLNFMNTVMQDQNGLFVDGYYVQEPIGTWFTQPTDGPQQQFPGNRLSPFRSDGKLRSRGYGVAWTLAFLEYTQPEETIADYPVFIENYGKELSGTQMYMVESMYDTGSFGTFDYLSSLFTLALAKQRGDFSTRDRIANFMFDPYNKVWSADGREMHYDTSSATSFLQTSVAYAELWANTPTTMVDLADARPAAFWDYPYISAADDENVWVYRAEWDPVKEGFILSIQVDQAATLTFSNFDSAPSAYSGGVVLSELTAAGLDYTLDLAPGTYHLVIK